MNFRNIFRSKSGQVIAATLLLSSFSCTDLNEEVRDEVLGGQAPSMESTLVAAYDRLGDATFTDNTGMISMQEYASDIALLATRGSDWGDGGKWREMHEFTWTPNSLIPSDQWNRLTNGISRSLTAIQTITNSDGDKKALYLAEAQALYAFYMFNTFDLYNQAPYRDPLDINAPVTAKQAPEGIDELITLVESLIPNLATLGDQSTHTGRFTKEAAYALLADMYLNRAVFKDRFNATSDFKYTEASLTTGQNDMDRVIYYTSLLINNSKFQLASNYFSNFDIANSGAPEHIFAIVQKIDAFRAGDNDLGYVNVERNQRPSPANRGTNAACMTTEFFHSWDGNQDDPRFSRKYQYSDGTWFMNDGTDTSVPASDVVAGTTVPWFHFNRGIIYGQQYGPKLNDKGGFVMDNGRIAVLPLVMEKNTNTPMNFTPDLAFDNPMAAVLSSNQLNQGARFFKFEFDPAGVSGPDNGVSGVDIPLYRLGGIYTMRAEAYFRKGQLTEALADINILRTSRTREALYANAPGKAIGSLDADILLRELGFELYWEMKRRPQLIRFGKLDMPFTAKPQTAPSRRAFPIPQSTIDVNKQFQQNSGY
ncbi:MAG TPA: RagB/SusD family nutrient uptake outer membrane protein [Chryseolinea sp.]